MFCQRSPRLCLHSSSKLHNSGEAEEMDDLQKNPHYAKYADKIAKLQKYDLFILMLRCRKQCCRWCHGITTFLVPFSCNLPKIALLKNSLSSNGRLSFEILTDISLPSLCQFQTIVWVSTPSRGGSGCRGCI